MSDEFDGVEWDEDKSARNEQLRGFGFDFAARLFVNDFFEDQRDSHEFGELRFVSIGPIDSLILTVIWTPRGTRRRIISARPASRKEREIYDGYRKKKAFRTRASKAPKGL